MSNAGVRIPQQHLHLAQTESERGRSRRFMLATRSPRRRTLCGIVEQSTQPISTDPDEFHSRALQNLFLLLSLSRSETSISKTAEDNGFSLGEPALSESERHSLELLKEWWWCGRDGDTLMETMVKPCIIYLAVAACKPDSLSRWPEKGLDRAHTLEDLAPVADKGLVHLMKHVAYGPSQCICHGAPSILQHLRDSEKMLQEMFGRDTHQGYVYDHVTVYHDVMIGLLWSHTIHSEMNRTQLEGMVGEASAVAAAQRIGRVCWRRHGPEAGGFDPILDESQRAQAQGHVKNIRDVTPGLPAIIDPCPWLKNEQRGSRAPELPHYLWDIEAESTIEVSGLDARTISYVVVSYTWGRWKNQEEDVQMPGVRLWRVPKNGRFHVEKLPSMLKELGFREKYVWIDVFCIPQPPAVGSLPDDLAGIRQKELARQAVIFQHATTAVAWLHDVSDWGVLRRNLEYIALRTLRDSHHHAYDSNFFNAIDNYLQESKGESPQDSGLLVENHPNRTEVVPVTWLTSLWTLQECMMRPDLLLLNETWEPLTIGGFPGRVGDLSALLYAHSYAASYIQTGRFGDDHPNVQLGRIHYEQIVEALPGGLRELVAVIGDVGLSNLINTHPIMALVMGRSRHCNHSRAEAIMSVAGATEWHLKKPVEQFRREQGKQDASELVCGLYPLPFVQEVYKRTGANFFMCWHDVSTVVQTPDGADGEMLRVNQGSMMPFMQNFAAGGSILFQSNPPGFRQDMDDHPAVADWEIQQDGSVRIPAAGIVASNLPPGHPALPTPYPLPEIEFMIGGNSPSRPGDTRAVSNARTSLVRWVQQMHGEVYAVCTVWSRSMMGGILLQRLDGVDFLVKAGNFAIDPASQSTEFDFELPKSTQVDWLVC